MPAAAGAGTCISQVHYCPSEGQSRNDKMLFATGMSVPKVPDEAVCGEERAGQAEIDCPQKRPRYGALMVGSCDSRDIS